MDRIEERIAVLEDLVGAPPPSASSLGEQAHIFEEKIAEYTRVLTNTKKELFDQCQEMMANMVKMADKTEERLSEFRDILAKGIHDACIGASCGCSMDG